MKPQHSKTPSARELLAKAEAQLELQEICAEAEKSDAITFEDSKPQFGIRHILIWTTLVAVIVTMYKAGGAGLAFIGLMFATLALGWIYVGERQRFHDAVAREKLDNFRDRHGDPDFDGLNINTIWRWNNRK